MPLPFRPVRAQCRMTHWNVRGHARAVPLRVCGVPGAENSHGRLVILARSTEAGLSRDRGEAMPFDGKTRVRVDRDPDAVAQARREAAREALASLDRLGALFDGGRRWIRKKEFDEK